MKIKNIAAVISLCSAMLLPALPANAAEALPTTAYISGQLGTTEVWSPDDTTIGSTVAEINGDAQYEAEWKVSDAGASELTFLALSIPNITSDSYPDINVNVTAVYIDGVKTGYTMSPNAINTAYYEAGKDPETRVYLYDGLNGTNVADLPQATPVKESIKVVFTVTGTGQFGTSNIAENVLETEPSVDPFAETSPETTDQGGFVETWENTGAVDASTTGDAGVAALAVAGLAVTAGAAIFSKVRFKKKNK
ncbi:MAG: hypothetical protein ACI4JB_07120 [Porcipelethomonas sp.]